MISYNFSNGDVTLHTPLNLPNASGFLWNKHMMIQMNCRGYATAQFMQPEPAKYAQGPALEATTFMQPEHPYFSHHPGRFFYIKDNLSGELFSLPYEPVRKPLDSFAFTASQSCITWNISHIGLEFELILTLATEDSAELWQLNVTNPQSEERDISIYTYFPIGYLSWMNQSAKFDDTINGIFCHSVRPYQKVEQYFKQQHNKDSTVLLSDCVPDSFETRQQHFEGEGGLHNPSALAHKQLANKPALYQTPAAVMQFIRLIKPNQKQKLKFVFAPVKDTQQAQKLKQTYLTQQRSFDDAKQTYQTYVAKSQGNLHIKSPNPEFDNFVNYWLPRQVFYHGDVNRLSTDPQTRNYLQDAMGAMYLDSTQAKSAFITALSQQAQNGEMPDGILLHPDAELKYINQVPHTDHCVWLVICIHAYLTETADLDFLNQLVGFKDSEVKKTVFEHICLAIDFLWFQRDQRGLNYINQGDWCDPMNMVGYKGKGVSSWLSLASAYAMKLWAEVASNMKQTALALQYNQQAGALNVAVNQYCWDGKWFARGITDNGDCFGVNKDLEGRIYLNPQTFAMLSGAAESHQCQQMNQQIQQQLFTPHGMMMLAPSYTHMREDIGRLTQKFPGTAENGSVYNHAGAFYIYALFEKGETERAFALLKTMLISESDEQLIKRGQLPIYVPNYYRGAYYQLPEEAGQSSHLFNTGTVAWVLRIINEQLIGLKGQLNGVTLTPKLPKDWSQIHVKRVFRKATLDIEIVRKNINKQQVFVDGNELTGNMFYVTPLQYYQITVWLPME